MKVLVDENIDGWDIKLNDIGFNAYSVRKLIDEGKRLTSDFSVMNYARDNDMILITKDKECIKGCLENSIRCISLDDQAIFEFMVSKLREIKE